MEKNKRRMTVVLCSILLFVCMASCTQKDQEDASIPIQESKALTVYVVGDAVNTYDQDGNMVVEHYFTSYAMGDFESARFGYAQDGHMWHSMLNDYAEENNIDLTLVYFSYPEELEQQLQQVRDQNEVPDVILNTFASYADYYAYMKEGYFADISSYMENDEIYSDGAYYERVMEGGKMGEKQYIFPILFNLSTIMTSNQNMNDYGLYIQPDMSLHELLRLLTANIYDMRDTTNYETVTEQISVAAYYIPHIIYSAAGQMGIEYETGEVKINRSLFEDLCVFTKALYQQQFQNEWDQYVENPDQHIAWGNTIKVQRMMPKIEEKSQLVRNHSGCLIEGGGSLNAWLHSAAALANYYESRYTDENKDFYIQGVPTWDQQDAYISNISAFGAVVQGSQNVKESYELLKYLADQEYFLHLGFSVNRKNTCAMLDQLASTEYKINNIYGHMPDQEYYEKFENKAETYTIKPLSSAARSELENILNHMEGATLPDWPVYQIYREAFEGYARESMSLDEAYRYAEDRLLAYQTKIQ